MSVSVTSPNTQRAGLCPHGLPPAACPICSGNGGMGGTGRIKNTPPPKSTVSNEWSWMKCYTAGLMMKSQQDRIESAKLDFKREIESYKLLQKMVDALADKIKSNLENIQNSLPKPISIPLQIITNFIVKPILNLISQLPKIMENIANFGQNLRNLIQQAGEKLTAVIGEMKNFVKSKIEDIKKRAKKIFLFFLSEIEDKDYKNDESLEVFKSRELKKYLLKIIKMVKKQGENDTGNSEK